MRETVVNVQSSQHWPLKNLRFGQYDEYAEYNLRGFSYKEEFQFMMLPFYDLDNIWSNQTSPQTIEWSNIFFWFTFFYAIPIYLRSNFVKSQLYKELSTHMNQIATSLSTSTEIMKCSNCKVETVTGGING